MNEPNIDVHKEAKYLSLPTGKVGKLYTCVYVLEVHVIYSIDGTIHSCIYRYIYIYLYAQMMHYRA